MLSTAIRFICRTKISSQYDFLALIKPYNVISKRNGTNPPSKPESKNQFDFDKYEKKNIPDANGVFICFTQGKYYIFERIQKEYFARIKGNAQNKFKVLDIGCGDGNWIRDLRNKINADNVELRGIDISKDQIQKAQQNDPENTSIYTVFDGTKDPPSDQCGIYDICMTNIVHVQQMDPKLLQSMMNTTAKYVKPGGLYIGMTMEFYKKEDHWDDMGVRVLEFDEKKEGPMKTEYNLAGTAVQIPHYNYRKDTFMNGLKTAGFDSTHGEYVMFRDLKACPDIEENVKFRDVWKQYCKQEFVDVCMYVVYKK